jgi:TPR repeat protein
MVAQGGRTGGRQRTGRTRHRVLLGRRRRAGPFRGGQVVRAAEQGATFAQISLAFLYERGEGVRQDFALADMWLNLAAVQGQPIAKIELERLASKMTSGQVAEAQRLARGWKPTK